MNLVQKVNSYELNFELCELEHHSCQEHISRKQQLAAKVVVINASIWPLASHSNEAWKYNILKAESRHHTLQLTHQKDTNKIDIK